MLFVFDDTVLTNMQMLKLYLREHWSSMREYRTLSCVTHEGFIGGRSDAADVAATATGNNFLLGRLIVERSFCRNLMSTSWLYTATR